MTAAEFLRAIEDKSLDALRTMVEMNSFRHNRAGVVANAEFCASLFDPLGFETRRVRSVEEDAGDHLVLTRAGSSGDSLVLVSHLDTVYPENFPWREEGDRICGPGVCDIKGGTIVMWMLLRTLRETEPELFDRVGWTLLWNASEEGGSADFPELARAHVGAGTRACLVYEAGMDAPDGSTIVIARKGAAHFRMAVEGYAAHAGNHHDAGVSAIRELAGKVECIEALTDYARGVTFNVGTIRGGTMINTVPAHASCAIDLRSPAPADYEWGRGQILGLAGPGRVTSGDGTRTCVVKVTERAGYAPWPENAASAELGARVVECGRQLGLRIEPERRSGASDGNHLYDLAPTVDGLGPVGRNAHRYGEESVDRSSFVPRALLSVRLIQELLA